MQLRMNTMRSLDRPPYCRLVVLLVAAIIAAMESNVCAEPGDLVSGEPLRVAINGGVGLLASPNAYKTVPIGCARVLGKGRPDLFVCATRGIEQGLYLYRWVRDNEQGQPVFAPPIRIKHPWADHTPPEGTIVEDGAGRVHGFWLQGRQLIHTLFDRHTMAFEQVGQLEITSLPRTPENVAVVALTDERIDVVVACYNGAKFRPAGDLSSDDYVLYNGVGVYRGQWPRTGLYRFQVRGNLSALMDKPHLFSPSADEILGGVALTTVAYPERGACVLAGASLGNIYCFGAREPAAKVKHALFGPSQASIRHPTIGTAPIAYPNAAGDRVDLIVGGEGSLYYYAFSGRFNDAGHPVYSDPQPVWQEDALLYAGSLAVPCVVDWDGDGQLDLVVGNSEGRVLFFRNHGTSRRPRFGIGVPLLAGGQPIHVQPGYYGIQGPFETRWGYTCPATADWNGDGRPDLLLSSATARHEVYLNVGTATQPQLAVACSLYCDGLELHGTWRVRPGVAKMDERMAYIIQDDGNALHRYWRIDDHNLADGGLLTMEDGSPITSHSAAGGPGQKGRGKIALVDWDGDGRLDLILGTAKRGSIPEPYAGIPWSLRRHGVSCLQVVLLRNVGTNAQPRYEKPRLFQFRGKDIYLGAHSNAPEAAQLGNVANQPNMVIGMESGRIYFFEHQDLTFAEPACSTGKHE